MLQDLCYAITKCIWNLKIMTSIDPLVQINLEHEEGRKRVYGKEN